MSTSRSTWWCILISLGVHVGIGLYFLESRYHIISPQNAETIEITQLNLENSTVSPSQPAPTEAVPPVKIKRRGIPVPALNSRAKQDISPQVTDYEKMLAQKIEEQKNQLRELENADNEAIEQRAQNLKPRSSAEIMADPQKGRVFVQYFGKVKEKIQSHLHDRFASRYSQQGDVNLFFILDSKGNLVRASVPDDEKQKDPVLSQLAVQCLQEAAPFGEFPQDLGAGRIAFNLTVVFDGT